MIEIKKRMKKKKRRNTELYKKNANVGVKRNDAGNENKVEQDKHIKTCHVFLNIKTDNKRVEKIKLITSIFLSVIGLLLTVQSNKIYKKQKEIQEKQFNPAIDISVVLKEGVEEEKAEIVDKFIVNNVGGIAEYIECDVRPFFYVCYSESEFGEDLFSDGVIVPIISYTEPVIANEKVGFRFGDISHIYANKNLLFITESMKRWKDFEVDSKSISGKKIAYIAIGYFLNIYCEDLFGEDWEEYYVCFPGYDIKYCEFPDSSETEIGAMKINEDDEDILDIAKICFGGEKIKPSCFVYERGKSDKKNYENFLYSFLDNCDKELFYNVMHSGTYDLIENENGEYEVKREK